MTTQKEFPVRSPFLGCVKVSLNKTPNLNCSQRAAWCLAWQSVSVDAWVCVWIGEWETFIIKCFGWKYYMNAVHLPFTFLRDKNALPTQRQTSVVPSFIQGGLQSGRVTESLHSSQLAVELTVESIAEINTTGHSKIEKMGEDIFFGDPN